MRLNTGNSLRLLIIKIIIASIDTLKEKFIYSDYFFYFKIVNEGVLNHE